MNGKEWKFQVAAFYLGAEKILSEDAALDEKIIKDILAIKGQNVLRELV